MSSTNNLSVFIPRVFINISKQRIASIFDKLDLSIVDKIDFVRKNGPNGGYNSAYIHMKYWLKTDASRNFRDKLYNSEEGAKLVYDEPWFWIVLPNTSDKPVTQEPRTLQCTATVSSPSSLQRRPSQSSVVKKSKVQYIPTTPPVSPSVSHPGAPVKLTPDIKMMNIHELLNFTKELQSSLQEVTAENINMENVNAAFNFIEELKSSLQQVPDSEPGSPRKIAKNCEK